MSLVSQGRGESWGADAWVVQVLRYRYRVPFRSLPLSRVPIPLPSYSTIPSGAGFVRCGVRLSGEGGHRDRASFTGILQSPLCHSQSHRGLATGHQSLMAQRFGGDCSVRSPISPSGGLDGVPGSPGCLPPGSGLSSFSPLPEVLRGGCGLSVSGPVLRPFFGPSGFHPRHGSYILNYASPRISSSPLPRRLASPGLHLPGTSASEGLPPLAVLSPGRHSQSFEELIGPDSDSGLSWDDARDFSFEGFPDPQTGSEVLSPSARLLVRPPPSCVGLEESSRDDVIHVGHCSRFSSLDAISPASPQCSRSSPARRGSRFQGRWLPQGSSVVVRLLTSSRRPSCGRGPPRSLFFSDASDQGWGAVLGDLHLSSLWSPLCLRFSINQRELLAILYAVQGFLPHLRGRSVAVYSDNSTALAYLRKQGGTRSSSLNAVAQELLRLCESQSVHLFPQFIPGHLNVLADSLSRRSQVLGSEWTLCPQAVSELLHWWPATIDLFATSLNHRLLVYFSTIYDPMSAGTDAMLQS